MNLTDNADLASLPITAHVDKICDALKKSPSRFLVLTAQTAAGKSTVMPLALLNAFSGKVLMLEVRRIAAVAIASRLSELLGEQVGETVGYRLHLDSCVGARTRLEVLTEAILTRRLQQDPALEGVSVVVLDEFHERSIHADVALAFLKEAMLLRDDLYVVVMSATMNTKAVSAYLGNAPVYSVSGRQFPVEICYQPELTVSRAVLKELYQPSVQKAAAGETTRADTILVFLPGISDIRRAKQEIEEALPPDAESEVLILHSSVPLAEQRAVLVPQNQKRRVILSSAIAETSLTVPGVSIVIDSGYARINRMNVALGMEKLTTERVSRFSAEQRAGRAGRLMPGRCIRLWNKFDTLSDETPPEITRTDLVPLVLECAAWGVTDREKLDWLTSPSDAAWKAAQSLLETLGCLKSGITDKGKIVLSLGIHPRLSCTVMQGVLSGALTRAVRCVLRFSNYAQSNPMQQEAFCKDLERRAQKCSQRILALEPHAEKGNVTDAELLLAGFPDRIGKRISAPSEANAEYQFPSGRKALLAPRNAKVQSAPSYLVAPEVDAGSTSARIYAYESLDEKKALGYLSARATTYTRTVFADAAISAKSTHLVKTEYTAYGALILKERLLPTSAEDYKTAVCEAVKKYGLSWLPLNDECNNLLLRARFYALHAGDGKALSAKLASLSAQAEEWLLPFLGAGNVTAAIVYEALSWYLDATAITKQVPKELTLANGKKRKLCYEDNGREIKPVLEIIIQQIFGCFQTPTVLGVPVLLKLLSPARRPLQITEDLAHFWENSWLEICKEMKGRYPKHNWDYRVASDSD